MAIELLESLATDFLEYEHLVTFHHFLEDSGFDDGAVNVRRADLHGALVVNEEYLVELYGSILGSTEALHEDFLSSFYFKLLACNFNDCVHTKTC